MLLDEISGRLEEGNDMQKARVSHGRVYELTPFLDGTNNGMPFTLPYKFKTMTIHNNGPSKVTANINLESPNGRKLSRPVTFDSGETQTYDYPESRIVSPLTFSVPTGGSAGVKIELSG